MFEFRGGSRRPVHGQGPDPASDTMRDGASDGASNGRDGETASVSVKEETGCACAQAARADWVTRSSRLRAKTIGLH
jgi:hypothetical protein